MCLSDGREGHAAPSTQGLRRVGETPPLLRIQPSALSLSFPHPQKLTTPHLPVRSVCKMRDARFSSKAYGTHEYKEIMIEGRVQFDLLQARPGTCACMCVCVRGGEDV